MPQQQQQKKRSVPKRAYSANRKARRARHYAKAYPRRKLCHILAHGSVTEARAWANWRDDPSPTNRGYRPGMNAGLVLDRLLPNSRWERLEQGRKERAAQRRMRYEARRAERNARGKPRGSRFSE